MDCNLLSLTCTKFTNKVVWVAKKNDWILSLSYELQRSRMLFHKLEICNFSKKHYFSRSPFRAVKCILTPPPPPLSHGLICKWQLFCAIMQHYGLNGTLTNLLPTVLVPVRSVQCRVYRGLQWLSSGRSGSGKILSRYFATGTKT